MSALVFRKSYRLIVCFFSIAFGEVALSAQQVFPTQFGGEHSTNVLAPVPYEGILLVDYEFYMMPDTMSVYYDGVSIFNSGWISGGGQFTIPYGPGASTSLMIVMNEGVEWNVATVWTYTPSIIPEPPASVLLVLGLALVVCLQRRYLGRR
jgi:hypothetical protein